MISKEKPSFIVVGPPRTGTSWLHKVLEPHATLPSPSKETRFFDLHFHRGFDWYQWHFPRKHHGPMGEVAPTYFASTEARQNIAETIPDAKVVFVFRNPVERAVSLYRLKIAYGMYRWSFEDALREDTELIASGLYWTHLREWRDSFPEKQLLATMYDDLAADPQAYVSKLSPFIGLEDLKLSEAQTKRVFSTERMTRPRSYIATRTATVFADWCKTQRLDHLVASVRESALIKLFLGGGQSLPQMPSETIDRLAELFRPEVEGLETYLGRNLDHWKAGNDLSESRDSRTFATARMPGVECSVR